MACIIDLISPIFPRRLFPDKLVLCPIYLSRNISPSITVCLKISLHKVSHEKSSSILKIFFLDLLNRRFSDTVRVSQKLILLLLFPNKTAVIFRCLFLNQARLIDFLIFNPPNMPDCIRALQIRRPYSTRIFLSYHTCVPLLLKLGRLA